MFLHMTGEKAIINDSLILLLIYNTCNLFAG